MNKMLVKENKSSQHKRMRRNLKSHFAVHLQVESWKSSAAQSAQILGNLLKILRPAEARNKQEHDLDLQLIQATRRSRTSAAGA